MFPIANYPTIYVVWYGFWFFIERGETSESIDQFLYKYFYTPFFSLHFLMFHNMCSTTTFTSKNIFFVHIFQKNQSRIIFLVFLCTYVQFWIQLCHNLCQKLLHCMEPYTYSPLKINLLTGNNGTTTINYTKKRVWCLLTMTNYFVKV